MNDEILYDEYFKWLMAKIEFGNFTELYLGLLDRMFSLRYFSTLPMDENRASDGKNLRYFFCEETGYDLDDLNWIVGEDCTVLEMLIAFADLIANKEFGDLEKGDRTPDWFWRMVKNLGLLDYPGDYLALELRLEVTTIIQNWLNRNIDYDGSGGLFPLKNPPGDERKVEFLYQMRAYLNENFPG